MLATPRLTTLFYSHFRRFRIKPSPGDAVDGGVTAPLAQPPSSRESVIEPAGLQK
jgi:hypothetical protein